MPSTRRRFLALSGLVSAGALFRPSPVAAMPEGARRPAPAAPPASASEIHKQMQSAVLGSGRIATDAALAELALDAARSAGASYADVRLVSWRRERVSVRDDHVSDVARSEEYGLGVRVLCDGCWGFAATPRLERAAVTKAAKRAVDSARTHAKVLKDVAGKPVELAPITPAVGQWVSPHEVDPFSVSVAEKADLLLAATRRILGVAGVKFASGSVSSVREEKLLLSSEGTRVHQLYFRTAPDVAATAVHPRHGFSSRDHEAQPMLAGWEYVRDLGLVEDAALLGEQAVQKLHAASVTPGKRVVVIAPSNLWLVIHESIGHSTELDRALGLEANYAGTSFLTRDKLGKLRIGSEIVNLVADRTQPGGLATTGWDDDGVPSGRWPLVEGGKFVGWQTTRDQASWIGEPRSRGCSYGEGYGGVAFQRMPNVSLQPGTEGYTTEDLVNATEDGILVSGRGSWSIDQQRYNFQFGGQFFWEIKKGRLTRPLKDVAYQANTVEFWNSCDMLGGAATYRLGGSFSDGKGEPSQSNAVSHGCPPARFMVNIVNSGASR